MNKAHAGDTVILEDGTYGHVNAVTGGDGSGNEYSPVVLYNSGTSSAWITIKAQHAGSAILDCEMICDAYINLYNAAYITIQDLVITRGYKDGIHSNDAAHDIALIGNTVEYIANRNTSTTYGLPGLYTNPNCYNFTIDRNVFHDIGRTNASSLDHALYLHGTNFTITNNIFYNIPHGWSIQAADGLSNVLVANNTFAFPQGGGQNGQIMLWNTQNNLTIQNNIFYSPLGNAITRFSSTVNSCAINHNLVYGASGVITDSTGCSLSSNQVGPNPKFVNVSTSPYDFHVQSGGPGIDTGVNLSAVPHDYVMNARPQGSSTDIGAYEYMTSSSSTTTTPSNPNSNSSLPPLSALWDFGELSGNLAHDSSGNGNTGVLNYTSWAYNVCSACVFMNGWNSYISVPESTSLETTSQMTVTMWLHPAAPSTVDPRPIAKLYSWDVKLNGGYYPQFSAGGMYGMLNQALTMNQWQHVAFTFSAGVLKGYVNGQPVSFSANTFTSGTTLPLQKYGVFLGVDSSQTAYYSGYMDDVRIYNGVLTDAQIANLYSTTIHK